MKTPPFLPYARQTINDDDIAAVTKALTGDFLTTGPLVEEFEHSLAQVTHAPQAVAVSSGSAALHISLLALAPSPAPGDCAVIPTITFVATANAARLAGLEVVYADINPATGLMGPEQLSEAFDRARKQGLTPRAVIAVHLGGQSCDMAALSHLARASSCAVIEDAAHAIGSQDASGVPVGACAHSDAVCFSFHPVKTITMGEGGAATVRDSALADQLRRLRSHGLEHDPKRLHNDALAFATDGSINPWYYQAHSLGLNYRVTDVQCALGLSQLRKLDRFVEQRAMLRRRYAQRLPADVTLTRDLGAPRTAWHLATALLDFSASLPRAAVMKGLRAHGIGSQVHYIPNHLQPYYQDRASAAGQKSPDLPGAMSYYQRCLSLPLFAAMSAADVDRVCVALAEVMGNS